MRRGMGFGRGRGYHNIMGKDPLIHSQSARGQKQPQVLLTSFGLRQRKLGTKQVIGFKQKDMLKDLTFKQLQGRGIRMRYWGDKDKDGVPNVKDCRPLDRKKQGGAHFWQVMAERGIIIEGTPQEKKVLRQVFEKRPELLAKAKDLTISIKNDDISRYRVGTKLFRRKVVADFDTEQLILSRDMFHEGNVEGVPEVKDLHADAIGAVLAHELKHREQAHTNWTWFAQESDDAHYRAQRGGLEHEEYVNLPVEKPAFAEMKKPRERDIEVPEKKRTAAFRGVFR